MKDFPLISILLVVYNQERYILEALESLVEQDYPNFELVITDDCSTDLTIEKINEYLESKNLKNNITVNVNDKNLGISKNVQLGLSICRGDYICLAAGDDISHKSRLSKSLNFLDYHKNISASFSNLLVIDEKSNSIRPYFSEPPKFCKSLESFLSGGKVWSIGASLFFKKELFFSFSPFLEGTYQEDGVIAFRALLRGGIRYNDEVLVSYRMHSNNASQNISIKNKIAFKERDIVLIDNMIKDIREHFGSQSEFLKEAIRRRSKAKIIFLALKIPLFSALIFSLSGSLRKLKIRK